ncbi:MAG: NUDIX hydrolase [Synergistaceae bacterium]|jgi:ADP-ribose pyrophosphatase|nr:NUDIX hydrolase [Synergistaceae bacterium]
MNGADDESRDFRELAEVRLSSRMIYEGRILSLRKDEIRLPDGRTRTREVVEHRRAVVILAENSGGEILMVNQFRYPAGEVVLELPAGIVERGEDCAAAAERELREETGWKPGKITKISEFYTSPGFCDEVLEMYYAADLSWDKLPEDEDEFIVSRFLSREDARKLAETGRIRDAKSLFGVYWWLHRNLTINRNDLPE